MISIHFDQYQRYKLAEIIISLYKEYFKLSTIKILEVGANEHKNLEKFLPNDDIYYLDISLPEELLNDPKYILGDATNLINIYDNEYDIAIALDVYEHIPNTKRKDFLFELERVSKYGVIICAPFNESYVEDAEVRANEYFKLLTNQDYIWLKEHIDEKLPCINTTNLIIEDLGLKYINFNHGDIYLWEKLIKYHFYVNSFSDISGYRELIDKFYNENLFFSDISKETYRTFIIYSKDHKLLDFISISLDNLFNKNIYDHDKKEFLDSLIYESKEINLINSSNNTYCKNIQHKHEMICYIKDDINHEFNENYTIKTEIYSDKIYEVLRLNNYLGLKEIRIDPIGSNCIIENFEVYSIIDGNRVDLEVTVTNADLEFNKIKFFSTYDPQIYINLENKDINCINVSYRLLEYDSKSINNVIESLNENLTIKCKEVESLNENLTIKCKEVESLNENLTMKCKEVESLNKNLTIKCEEVDKLCNTLTSKENIIKQFDEQLKLKEKELNNIKNTRSWKIITKIRRIIGK